MKLAVIGAVLAALEAAGAPTAAAVRLRTMFDAAASAAP